ncbi:ribosome biogenesis GTP-binding protein YihA/YsxC [Blattabacterium cuenoti]|uniref:ribosome biogenesis GTP-binding protein YihA/YsxC n=1 Tax=Blattabacterium cuenoti TaxID=1653831 RepID=UPI00163B66C2|nr:ribosome biogenesis GTP-binding protein YihA/YsxC [Blattabacterium cuenoti]
MKIFSVKFKRSTYNFNQLFIKKNPEYAFAGRSNVGKSSLINCIINRKKIAKVSSHPGSTKLINHYLINNKWYLIDLPGYGYFSEKKNKKKIQELIENYIFHRKNINCLFLLIDCRFIIQKIDLDFIQKLNNKKIHFCIVFTKIDKLNCKTLDKNIFLSIKKIKTYKPFIWFKVSIKKKYGKNDIIQYIKKLNNEDKFFYKQKLIIPNS